MIADCIKFPYVVPFNIGESLVVVAVFFLFFVSFPPFDCKLCKVLDKLVRKPLMAVRSASVLLAPAAKAEIVVDSRILLHRPGGHFLEYIGHLRQLASCVHFPQISDD